MNLRLTLNSDMVLGVIVGAVAVYMLKNLHKLNVEEMISLHLTADTQLAEEEEIDLSEWFEDEEENNLREDEHRWRGTSFGFGAE